MVFMEGKAPIKLLTVINLNLQSVEPHITPVGSYNKLLLVIIFMSMVR